MENKTDHPNAQEVSSQNDELGENTEETPVAKQNEQDSINDSGGDDGGDE